MQKYKYSNYGTKINTFYYENHRPNCSSLFVGPVDWIHCLQKYVSCWSDETGESMYRSSQKNVTYEFVFTSWDVPNVSYSFYLYNWWDRI